MRSLCAKSADVRIWRTPSSLVRKMSALDNPLTADVSYGWPLLLMS